MTSHVSNHLTLLTSSAAVATTCVIITLLSLACAATAADDHSSSSSPRRVVHLSDLHFDPYFGTPQANGACTNASVPPHGLPSCDSSWTNIRSAIADSAESLRESPAGSLFIYTGDSLRHKMTKVPGNVSEVGVEIFTRIVMEFAAQFNNLSSAKNSGTRDETPQPHHHHVHIAPAMPWVNVLGNEDTIPDYFFPASAGASSSSSSSGNSASAASSSVGRSEAASSGSAPAERQLLADMAALLQQHGFLNAVQAAVYAHCAFVSTSRPAVGGQAPLRVISLNTIIWFQGSNTFADPCGQFAWLTGELMQARAAGERAYIVGHIPPIHKYWPDSRVETFRGILESYADVIAAVLMGHHHRFIFGAMKSKEANVLLPPFFMAGGITRIDLSNPQYSIMPVDAQWTVLDVTQRYMNPLLMMMPTAPRRSSTSSAAALPTPASVRAGTTWLNGERSLREIFNLENVNTTSLQQAGEMLYDDSKHAAQALQFYTFYMGGFLAPNVTCDGHCRRKLACLMIAFTKKEIDKCKTDGHP